MSARLPADLEAPCADLRDLVGVMQKERAHLEAGQVEALETVVTEKNRLVARLARSGDELRTHASEVPRGPLWDDLLQLAAGAQEINRINGALIQRHLDATALALRTLRGAASESPVYGADGRVALGRRL